MKSKRLLSMVLSLIMVISCIAATPFSAAASEVVNFTNLVADPGFDGTLDTNVWVMSGSAEGNISIVADSKDLTNKVLRVDCSENSKSISYVNYKSLNIGTYYMHLKVRLANVDQPAVDNYYLLANSMSGLTTNYNATRPAITKDGWAECYGVFKVTSDNASVGFKIIYTQNKTGNNVAKAVYEFDDFTIYNMENAKTISLPTGVAFASDNVIKSHDNKYYAKQGSTVSVTYENEGYTLTADTADITKDGNTYSFTVGDSNVTISEAEETTSTEFENMVTDPGFDGTLDTNVWVMSASAEGNISIVEDSKDSTNKVLRVDCSENSKSISYVNYKSLNKGTYYMHLKVRLADVQQPEADNYYLLANSMSGLTTNYNATRPAITKDGWADCYGVFNVTSDNASVGFKIINSQKSTSANVAKAVYEFDDLTIYNLVNAKNITVAEGVSVTSDNVVESHDGTYYAVQGSEVELNYNKAYYTLTAEGAELTQDGNTYTFTVGNSNVTINTVCTITEFENMVADPGFDGTLDSNVWVMSASAEGNISIVDDSKDSTNKVLRVDCSENSKNISYVNYKSLNIGTYYMHLKIRLADVVQPEAEKYYLYAGSLGGAKDIYWDATRPAITKDGWAECYGVFKVTADNSSVGFKIIFTQGTSGDNVSKAVYEIDDLTIYNLVNAKNIAVPAGVTFTSDNVVKSHDKTYYAITGDDVTFECNKTGLEALYINGAVTSANDGVYSYTADTDAVVLAVANQANEKPVKYAFTADKAYAIFDEAATVTLIVAGYEENDKLSEVHIEAVEGKAGQVIDLSTIDKFKNVYWADKTVFTWDNLSNITPLRSTCVFEDL